ncbi:uncharacterized protein V1516DRAFT_673394 [Lipomyces oligophaga]|uniref:uncharacterized protein n=1 Tax=Lipomyces oligophaga TaxID=45792 RepID=UPI0034D00026
MLAASPQGAEYHESAHTVTLSLKYQKSDLVQVYKLLERLKLVVAMTDRSIVPDIVDSPVGAKSTDPLPVPLNSTPAPKSAPPAYTPTAATSSRPTSTGPSDGIGSSPATSGFGNMRSVGGDQIQDRRFAGGDTLDEPVLETLMRDVRAVGRRVKQVLHPKIDGTIDAETGQIIREWDLWGPLVFCLFMSLFLSIAAPHDQTTAVFSGVFAFVWIAEAFVTLNMKLLGGSMSFFHAVCILGYALFPLVPASIFTLVIENKLIRFPLSVALVSWSLFAAIRTLKGAGVREGRVVLAMYPVYLFYGLLGWLCVIT